jgi:ABC-type glycerol-3-phosphate transport system substrate-binding protein
MGSPSQRDRFSRRGEPRWPSAKVERVLRGDEAARCYPPVATLWGSSVNAGDVMRKPFGLLPSPMSRRGLLRLGASTVTCALVAPHGGRRASAQNPSIEMWSNRPEWIDPIHQILEAFEKTMGIAVELTGIPSDIYRQKLLTATAGGELPDVVGYIEGTSIRDSVSTGDIVPLSERILDGLIQTVLDQVYFDGGPWGCPLASYTLGVFYHPDMFASAGISVPDAWNWDTLRAICQQLKDAGQTAMMMPASDGIVPYFFYILAASSVLGVGGFAALRNGERRLTEDVLVAAAQLLVDLRDLGAYNDDFATLGYGDGHERFANEQAALIVGSSWDYSFYRQVNPAAAIGFLAFPTPPTGGTTATVTGLELIYAVSAMSAQQDAAAQLVMWLATAEAQQLVANLLALPIRNDVRPANDPVLEAIVAARAASTNADVSAWYDVPELANSFAVAATALPQLLSGEQSAQSFAELMANGGY